jgi:predicted ATP-grasp superfamily ATP-dependent carboligase
MLPLKRIFVYEFVSGGGCYSTLGQIMPEGSLLAEGEAMLAAAAADLLRLPQTGVHFLRDARLPELHLPGCVVHRIGTAEEERSEFFALAGSAAGSVVIAPEIGGALLERVEWAVQAGANLWGPGARLVSLASDKQRLADHLAAAGLPVPAGRPMAPGESLPMNFAYPAVLKPRDGAGSQNVQRIDAWSMDGPRLAVPGRLEVFCPGLPASIGVLCGPAGSIPLPPCAQILSDDGRFAYLGGYLPLPPTLAKRAEQWGLRVISALPAPRGYIGIDLVLGADPHGNDDVIIEINPRLTTSYLGLRAACEGNLMGHWLDVLSERPVVLCLREGAVQFDAISGARKRS